MAAVQDNLPCPWHVNQTRDSLDRFRLEREKGQRKSEDRRMELQGNFLKLQQDRQLGRATRLRRRWQELAEREAGAWKRNQQLLQDFQRAQVTLEQMVSRTHNMNTVRLEYKMYLEENDPRWHRQLNDHTRATHKKRSEELLKDCLKRREDKEATASFTKEHFCPLRGTNYWPQRATPVPRDSGENGRPGVSVPPAMPPSLSSWPLPACSSQDASPCHPSTVFPPPPPPLVSRQTPSPQQGPPPQGGGAPQTGRSPSLQASSVSGTCLSPPWAPGRSGWGLGPDRGAEGMGGAEPKAEGRGETLKRGGKRLSQDLKIKPVGLSSSHGDGSDGGSSSGGGRNHGDRGKEREEGRQPSGLDSETDSRGSAGRWSTNPEAVPPTPTTFPLTRGRGATGSRDSSSSSSGTAGHNTSSRGPKSVPECGEVGRESDPDPLQSPAVKSCRSLRVKPCSTAEASSGHRAEGEDPTESSVGSAEKSGRRTEPEGVRLKGRRGQAAAGEEAADTEDDRGETEGEHACEHSSSEEEGNRPMEEGGDEEVSQSEEEEEEEDERIADDEGQESDASGQEEGREQTGSSESRSSAMSRAGEQQEGKDLQAEMKDDVDEWDEVEQELGEEESGSEEGVGIVQPQAGESEEETDSDDGIISPQKRRYLKEVQGVSEDEQGESDGSEEGEDGTNSVGDPDSDDEEEDGDIERLLAPQVETQRKQRESVMESRSKTKVIKKDSRVEESLSDSDKQAKMKAEDTDDEFDHFYD